MRSNDLTNSLEASLGPGTAELALRFGIHTGPVTAGVLRGEKARFQLFGDTMNFASRIESTGMKNKIHLSKAVGDTLISRGKGHWVRLREGTVFAKGKGDVQTYWLQTGSASNSVSGMSTGTSTDRSCTGSDSGEGPERQNFALGRAANAQLSDADLVLRDVVGKTKPSRSIDRLVEWNTGALMALLKKVVLGRGTEEQKPSQINYHKEGQSRSFVNEIEMVIALPQFNEDSVNRFHLEDVDLPRSIQYELRTYIAAIASGYR
jgi:hypothetical protein